ncbi:extracellular catalytic domain type 1 short-chain-length polyhydroxyalkanoate depolymerase [Paraburkholderia lacunae]|uniref:Poly(3-hydroxyalkanoate) depolymerase n=1 Tax=Paraburkholderia lacunae TaxID=2211104 RepID=A0A370NBA4_9BURK|nr:PHB depolymerase family esterase [Paraburkholderia lacunae]RDK02855.1 poly(3-hydroxyalkanoate) depolymerase [Paraburkholderia lacunae]
MKLNEGFLNAMREAMTLLRTRGPAEATEVIQRALRGETAGAANESASRDKAPEPVGFRIAEAKAKQAAAHTARDAGIDVEDRGHFSTLAHSNTAGSRQYRLYVPAETAGEPLPLIVMLHGCTQNADDFAAGTQMNALAGRHRCLVAYPVQPRRANPSKCWNWFKPEDQHREGGEPSLIAGITRDIIAAHHVDPARVYVAGMSAGGAMAAIMLAAYPELYAAAGVHSGLPARCAHDLPSALAAMKGGKRPAESQRAKRDTDSPQRPMIVFHGDADATVHIANAARLVHGFEARPDAGGEERRFDAGRRACTVSRLVSSDGVDAELWTIHGAPHAWAGGNARGSYTDPTGPDASAEMLRFFLDHPQRQ